VSGVGEPLRKLPNFFLVGAPKCGTTSLARYLEGHPQVFVTRPKEPGYFARSLLTEWGARRARSHQLDWDDYLRLFQAATGNQVRRGEATTRYLRCEAALREIKTRCPEARLIALLRDPVAMVESWHAQKLWEKQETEPDLERAWRLEDSRRRGRDLPARLKATDAVFYSQVARLGAQVERLLEIFPRDQVQLILLDDLQRDAARVYQEVLGFLGVSSDGRTDFGVHNPRRTLTANRILSALRLAAPRRPSGTISPAFENELRQFFEPEVVKLERILARDLSAWRNPVRP
jgi:hypothetical protein